MSMKVDLIATATEKQFRAQILDLARLLKWKPYFTWTSVHSPAGFPDLVLARERIVFAELKTETGKVSSAQQDWIDCLTSAGAEVYLWRPSDFDAIFKILSQRDAPRRSPLK